MILGKVEAFNGAVKAMAAASALPDLRTAHIKRRAAEVEIDLLARELPVMQRLAKRLASGDEGQQFIR
jgi:hypothetical protein